MAGRPTGSGGAAVEPLLPDPASERSSAPAGLLGAGPSPSATARSRALAGGLRPERVPAQPSRAAFKQLATDLSPFVPAPATPAGLHFVRPELVVEVQFNEMTTVGVLRQPSLKGLRDDVEPASVGWSDELT